MTATFFLVLSCIYVTFAMSAGIGSRALLQEDGCCAELGALAGLTCACRQSCAGNDCDNAAGIGASCGTGVCCCGLQCNNPPRSDLDFCPTADPTVDPTSDPTSAPTTDPTAEPTASPTTDPTAEPTASPTTDPTKEPTASPTTDPTTEPTPQCPDFVPPTFDDNDIPVPDLSLSPKLCQLGRSGTWTSVDQYYSFDCSCYDASTQFKLTQLVLSLFYEFNLNFNQPTDGRFESYFANYAANDIFFQTSVTAESGTGGPSWSDLDSFTSCDPENPGFGEFSRQTSEIIEFQNAPGGVYVHECGDDGNTALVQLKINNYRLFDGLTEDQVAFGDLTFVRDPSTNIWLLQQVAFTPQTMGFIEQVQT